MGKLNPQSINHLKKSKEEHQLESHQRTFKQNKRQHVFVILQDAEFIEKILCKIFEFSRGK